MSRPSIRLKRFHYQWAPVLFWMALIFLLSSFSFHFQWFGRSQKMHADWLAHVVEYSFLGFLLARALWRHSLFWRNAGRVWTAVLFACVLVAASDEFHQRFVPGRDSSVYDCMADTLGAAIGAWAWLKKQRTYA